MAIHSVGVTILSGFLGSGKTSLLNNIVVQNPNTRFMIIENEFGAVNIDRQLIKNIDKTQIFELSNGCACCTLSFELNTILSRLINISQDFDHLIIEASGIADPASIVATFLSGKRVRRYYKLNAVVCLVDAARLLSQIDEYDEIVNQIAIAQSIIINKTDEVDILKLEEVETKVKSINPSALIQKTTHSDVSTTQLLSINAYDSNVVEQGLANQTLLLNLSEQNKSENNRHFISTYAFEFEGSFKMESFSYWLDSFLYYNKQNVLRIKGVVAFAQISKKIIVQAVQDSIVVEQGEGWGEASRNIKLVIIGKELNYKELYDKIESLIEKE